MFLDMFKFYFMTIDGLIIVILFLISYILFYKYTQALKNYDEDRYNNRMRIVMKTFFYLFILSVIIKVTLTYYSIGNINYVKGQLDFANKEKQKIKIIKVYDYIKRDSVYISKNNYKKYLKYVKSVYKKRKEK